MRVLILAFLLAGCASGPYPTWIGAPLDDLVNAWGPPDRVATLPDGTRVVKYTDEPGVRTSAWSGRQKSFKCETEWWAKRGIITRFRWRGDHSTCKKMIVALGQGPNQRADALWFKTNRY